MACGFIKWEIKQNPLESEFIPMGVPTFCDPPPNLMKIHHEKICPNNDK